MVYTGVAVHIAVAVAVFLPGLVPAISEHVQDPWVSSPFFSSSSPPCSITGCLFSDPNRAYPPWSCVSLRILCFPCLPPLRHSKNAAYSTSYPSITWAPHTAIHHATAPSTLAPALSVERVSLAKFSQG
jgi:hypothetical protein